MDSARGAPVAKQNIGHHEPPQPWTATRCHRLLRPLLAHIAALRKGRAMTGGAAGSCKRSNPEPVSGPAEGSKRRRMTSNTYRSKASQRTASYAQETTPRRPSTRQRPRQKLGANKAVQPVAMTTPFLKKVKNHQLSSPVTSSRDDTRGSHQQTASRRFLDGPAGNPWHPCSWTSRTRPRFSVDAELSCLRATATDPAIFALYEPVLRTMDSLLRATSPGTPQPPWMPCADPPGPGASSLLAMCIRKVPQYIAALEYQEKEDAKTNGKMSVFSDGKVSFEVYSDLASLGLAADGWKHLCHVARAHGIQILQGAVEEGLFGDEVTELCIQLCLEYMPHPELSGLIDAFVFRQYPNPAGEDSEMDYTDSNFFPLRIVHHCDLPGTDFRLGMLARLLADGCLPARWVLTRGFGGESQFAIRQMLCKTVTNKQASADLLTITIELLCSQISTRTPKGPSEEEKQVQEKAQRMLTSLLGALASILILGIDGPPNCIRPQLSESAVVILRKRIFTIFHTCINKIQRARRATRRDLGIYLLKLCIFLSPNVTSSASIGIKASWQDATSRKCHKDMACLYNVTLNLVGELAYNCGRGAAVPLNDYLAILCDKLRDLDLAGDPLGHIRVDGAFYLAQQSGSLQDLAFAESLRAAAKVRRLGEQPQEQPDSLDGKAPGAAYTWDDDIGEWVIAQKKSNAARALPPCRSTRASLNTTKTRSLLSLAECIANFQETASELPRRPRLIYNYPESLTSDDEDSNDANSETSEADQASEDESPDTEGLHEDMEGIDNNVETADENAESLPEDNYKLDDNSKVLDDNSEVLDDNSEVLDDDSEVSDDNSKVLDDNSEVSDHNPQSPLENSAFSNNNSSIDSGSDFDTPSHSHSHSPGTPNTSTSTLSLRDLPKVNPTRRSAAAAVSASTPYPPPHRRRSDTGFPPRVRREVLDVEGSDELAPDGGSEDERAGKGALRRRRSLGLGGKRRSTGSLLCLRDVGRRASSRGVVQDVGESEDELSIV